MRSEEGAGGSGGRGGLSGIEGGSGVGLGWGKEDVVEGKGKRRKVIFGVRAF